MPSKAMNQYKSVGLWTCRPWVLLAFLLLTLSPFMSARQVTAAEAVPSEFSSGSLLVLPYLQVYVDDTRQVDIQRIQTPEIQAKFTPFDFKQIHQNQGTLWLKLNFAPQQVDAIKPTRTLLLDLGQGAGENAKLYALEKELNSESVSWREYSPSQSSVFLMPAISETPMSVYVRLEGIPGIWFAPYLRTPHNIATSYELFATPAAIVALFVVMLLCLLRGFTEKGQWRYWAALYTGAVLYYAMYGIPISGLNYVPMEYMLSAIAPGLCVILFAHVGRHVLLGTHGSRIYAIQFMALTLLGTATALLPLVPGFAWTVRYLNLWPLLLLLFVPTALGAWLSGIVGAKRYLLACLLPPLGVAIALLGLYEPAHFEGMDFLPMAMLSAIPLCALALGTLVLAGTTSIRSASANAEQQSYAPKEETIDDLIEQDPNLRLVPAGEAQSDSQESSEDGSDGHKKIIAELEEQLHWPVEQLLRDVAGLEGCTLDNEAREKAVSIVGTAREICTIINTSAKNHRAIPALGGTEERVFDLQGLLRQAHDSVAPGADKKNIALSWFMQPDLSPCYKGDAHQLLLVLRLLLESAVRSTHRGAVHLNVRRVPESMNSGHLLFTVTDSGTGKPPQDRSVTALARAWELSAAYRGFLGVESNALGASISFTMHLQVCASTEKQDDIHAQDEPRPIILLSDNMEERQLWGFFLEKMPRVLEARNEEELLEMYNAHSANLIIFDARMSLGHVHGALHGLWQISEARGEEFPECMAIYMDPEMEQPLLDMGFSYVFAMPVTRHGLFTAVQEILTNQVQRAENIEELETLEPRAESTEESEKLEPQQVQDDTAQTEDDDIVDTGEPILEMAQPKAKAEAPLQFTAQAPTESRKEKTSLLSLAESLSFEPDLQKPSPTKETKEEEQTDTPQEQSSTGFVWNDEYSAENSLFKNFAPGVDDEDYGQQRRPKPSQDKSNAAYLTSLVDMQQSTESKNEPEKEAEGEKPKMKISTRKVQNKKAKISQAKEEKPKMRIALGKKAEPESESTEPQLPVQEPAPVMYSDVPNIKIVPAQSAEPVPSKKAVPSIQLAPKAKQEDQKAPTEAEKSKPSASKAIGKIIKGINKKLVMPKKVATETTDAMKATEENKNSALVEKAKAKTTKKSMSIAPAKLNPFAKKSDEDKALVPKTSAPHDAIEWVGEPMPIQKPTPAKDSKVAQENSTAQTGKKSVSGKVTRLTMPQRPKQDEAVAQAPALHESNEAVEWVGEPMPIQKSAISITPKEKASEPAKKRITKLAMPKKEPKVKPALQPHAQEAETSLASPLAAPLTLNAEKQPSKAVSSGPQTLSLSPQAPSTDDAEKRGREELRHLRSYLDSSHALDNKQSSVETTKTPAPKTTAVEAPTTNPNYHGDGGVSRHNYNYDIATEPLQETNDLSPIERLLVDLDNWLMDAKNSYAMANPFGVEIAAGNMSTSADSFGLRTLARLARTVEAAARAKDLSALGDLLPELDISVQRNRAALKM